MDPSDRRYCNQGRIGSSVRRVPVRYRGTLTPAEQRVCELARQETPDALIHFVNRTKGIYNLLVDDYVSKADVQRWEVAKRKRTPDSPAVARGHSDGDVASENR